MITWTNYYIHIEIKVWRATGWRVPLYKVVSQSKGGDGDFSSWTRTGGDYWWPIVNERAGDDARRKRWDSIVAINIQLSGVDVDTGAEDGLRRDKIGWQVSQREHRGLWGETRTIGTNPWPEGASLGHNLTRPMIPRRYSIKFPLPRMRMEGNRVNDV